MDPNQTTELNNLTQLEKDTALGMAKAGMSSEDIRNSLVAGRAYLPTPTPVVQSGEVPFGTYKKPDYIQDTINRINAGPSVDATAPAATPAAPTSATPANTPEISTVPWSQSGFTKDDFQARVSNAMKNGVSFADAVYQTKDAFAKSGVDSDIISSFTTAAYLEKERNAGSNIFQSPEALKLATGYNSQSAAVRNVIDTYVNRGFTDSVSSLYGRLIANNGSLDASVANTPNGQKALNVYSRLQLINSGADMASAGIVPGTEEFSIIAKNRPDLVADYNFKKSSDRARDEINNSITPAFSNFFNGSVSDNLAKTKIQLRDSLSGITSAMEQRINSVKMPDLGAKYEQMISKNPEFRKLSEEIGVLKTSIEATKGAIQNVGYNVSQAHSGSTNQAAINAEIQVRTNILNQQLTQMVSEYEGKEFSRSNMLKVAEDQLNADKQTAQMEFEKQKEYIDVYKSKLDSAGKLADVDIAEWKFNADRMWDLGMKRIELASQFVLTDLNRAAAIDMAKMNYDFDTKKMDYANTKALELTKDKTEFANQYKMFSQNLSTDVIDESVSNVLNGTPIDKELRRLTTYGAKPSDLGAFRSLVDVKRTANIETKLASLQQYAGTDQYATLRDAYDSAKYGDKSPSKDITEKLDKAKNAYIDTAVQDKEVAEATAKAWDSISPGEYRIPVLDITLNSKAVQNALQYISWTVKFSNNKADNALKMTNALQQGNLKDIMGVVGNVSEKEAELIQSAMQSADKDTMVNVIKSILMRRAAFNSITATIKDGVIQGFNMSKVADQYKDILEEGIRLGYGTSKSGTVFKSPTEMWSAATFHGSSYTGWTPESGGGTLLQPPSVESISKQLGKL